jgi:sarcosine oxidase subunit alpha
MSNGVNRVEARAGEWLDRSQSVSFTFDGKPYKGHAGDTIASALAANGQWMLSRSFKYHRPRGVLTMAGQDANTLVQLPDEPNVLADVQAISEGLKVEAQNVEGSLDSDRNALIGSFSKFLPVGFYYKTFFRPRGAWKFWEPKIRKMAGLGIVNENTQHGYYDKAYGWYDVVVIGGGPAGMAAASTAAKAGAEVLLVEETPHLGGSLNYARFDADGAHARSVLGELKSELDGAGNVEIMTSAICNGWFTENWLPIIQGNRLHKIRAKHVVLATGSIEQPAVFRNNDLPGIMQASAAQRLMRQYGVRPGKRAVIATANADGYATALDLVDAGCEVAAVLDLRDTPSNGAIVDAVRDHGIDVRAGHTAFEALATSGNKHVRGVSAAKITGPGACAPGGSTIECDLVCMATGFTPTHHLLSHAGGEVGYDASSAMFCVREVPEGISVAGSLNASYALDAAIAEGRHRGWAAAKSLGLKAGRQPSVPNDRGALNQSHAWPIFPHPKGKDFVDFDEDLQVRDIRNAVLEGYEHIELVKRYSTVGMGPSQGRHSALTSARLTAEATGQDMEVVGRTTSRPPFTAEKMGVLAGRSFEPVRYTAMHHRHLEMGAQMMPAGVWLRPAYYGPKSKRASCIEAEAVNVRENVGIIDVSTLGGLEVRGPDAAEFLERMYTFAYKKQPVGRSRYVLLTDETGVIADDGVACRMHEQHFYVTATTGGVDNVYREMLWRNAQWRLDVDVTNVTAAYAGVNIAGPLSREVLKRLCTDTDLSSEGFPYMGVRTGTVAGIPARLLRVGFVGELGYEIHVPASQGEALWDALFEAGAAEDIKPFGVEAQRLLRLEKGHIIISQDTDGLTHPHEADMAWAIARKKPYFVGGRSIEIQVQNGVERKLVGFRLADANLPVPEECHLTVRGKDIVGRVTSAARSPALRKIIGLAYVAPDQTEPGTRFSIKVDRGRIVQGEVVKLPFYDPDGTRQDM